MIVRSSDLTISPDELIIRVRLAAEAPTIAIGVDGSYQVIDVNGQVVLDCPEPMTLRQVRLSPGSSAAIDLGGPPIVGGQLRIRPAIDGTLVVGQRRYRGELILQTGAAGITVTNSVHVEPYLQGVLHGELPASFADATFGAQAIAARTYALYQKLREGPYRNYDVLATEASQMYIGVGGESPRAIAAVNDTRGIVLTWTSPQGERIFPAYYSSTCGGGTQSVANVKPEPEIPPLAGGVPCRFCWESPHFKWAPAILSPAQITDKLRAKFRHMADMAPVADVRTLAMTPDGRAITLAVDDANGRTYELRGEDFRLAIGSRTLKSTRFRIERRTEGFAFVDGGGFGHGMGMCQYGAEGMARLGASAAQILRYYYPGCHLTKAYP